MLLAKIRAYFLSFLTNSIITCEILNNFAEEGRNFTLYQVTAFTGSERTLLQLTQKRQKYTAFLNGITNEAALPMYVAVNNCCLQKFTNALTKYAIPFAKISDYYYEPYMLEENSKRSRSQCIWNEIRTWIKIASQKFPNLLTESIRGHTYEHREVSVLKVSKQKRKMAVFIVGGEEGRDWTSPAIILQFMNNILERNPGRLMDYFDFFFVPLLNPDGYIFSRLKERFWAKNRKQFYSKKLCSDNTLALGVNLDRNWFEESQGFERWDCGNFYPGDHPLSEEETLALVQLLNEQATRTIAFFNLRGFDQLITLPYAQKGKVSINHNSIIEIFNFAVEQLEQKYNTTYYLGSTNKFFYNVTGNCADWVKKYLNVPVVATIYMKHSNILADNGDMVPMFQQFETLMVDVLDLAKDLYSPLFNAQRQHSSAFWCSIITIHIIVHLHL